MNAIARKMYSFIRFYLTRLSKSDPAKEFVFVAIGDSAVMGMGATNHKRSYTGIIYSMIKERFPRTKYFNFGKFGASTHDVITEQLDKAVELNPDLVTISVGANDMNKRILPKSFGKNLQTIVERFQKETTAKIVINNLPDFTSSPAISRTHRNLGKLVISQYNKAIEKVASDADVFFIDLYSQSKVYAKHYPELLADDQFHPSDFGHALWANTIMTSIEHHILPKHR